MQQTLSVVLERGTRLTGEFKTEPYEVAWAREARWFIHALDVQGGGTRLEARTQVSPDGLHWCDLDDRTLSLSEPGLVSRSVQEFGGWLRLKGTVSSNEGSTEEATAKVMIYLVLKG